MILLFNFPDAFKPIIRRSNETRAYKDNTQTVEIVIGSQVHAVEGLSLKISCPVTGTPNPTVTWYFNNAKLKMNSLHMQDKENDALIIPRLNPSLQGGYTCRAENSLGEDEASSSVSVMCKFKDFFFSVYCLIALVSLCSSYQRVRIFDS